MVKVKETSSNGHNLHYVLSLITTPHSDRGVGAGGDKNKKVFICREVCVCARVLGNRRVGWVTVL